MVKSLRNYPKPVKKLWLLLALGLVTTTFVLTTAARTTPLIFIGDFERKDFSGWKLDLCCKHSGEIVSYPVRAGNYAAKFTLDRNDPLVENGKRAELKRYTLATMGSEFWYGFSIFIPSNWLEDTAPEIITQWHDIPDFWSGENWKRPPFTLSINNNTWQLGNVWDTKMVTKNNDVTGKEVLWSSPLKKGVWTDWVFHVKWSHKSDGIIEVWQDNMPIVNKHGPNTYNDLLIPYLKVGPYKYPWKKGKPTSIVNERVIYFDEVRIGNANASYEDVAPTQSIHPVSSSSPE